MRELNGVLLGDVSDDDLWFEVDGDPARYVDELRARGVVEPKHPSAREAGVPLHLDREPVSPLT